MSDQVIQAELLAACSSLGFNDGAKYNRDVDTLETLKDLIRYLRRDDDSHKVRRALGETKVVQTDLVPILKSYSEDNELFDVTLRLLVNLTHPVVLLFNEELPEEKVTRQQYLQIYSHQQDFKAAFADEKVWSVLTKSLEIILNKDWTERDEEEGLMLERILILVRNILAVASSPEDEKRTDDDASVHDHILWSMHLAKFEDVILYLASSKNEQNLYMHIIEIISLMLKEQDPLSLARSELKRLQSEKEKDESELMSIRRKEAAAKQEKIKKHFSARHSRFGGTYYVKNLKSIGENDIITHKNISNLDCLNFDKNKRPKKIPKNRLPMKDFDITRRSTLAIRLFLQQFSIEFLNGAFNGLMNVVKSYLDRSKAQEHDETYYLWCMKFFLEFNRSHNFRVELITETLNMNSFHFIQRLLENYFEMMTTDKKKIPIWSRRMHKALKAYKELLLTLALMDSSGSRDLRESSKVLKNKVFYVDEYRELVLIQLQNYDEVKMSKNYLKDLIETSHIFLKLLQGLSSKQNLLVEKTKIIKKKTKPKNKKKALIEMTEDELKISWESKSSEILNIIRGDSGELPVTIPFDALSEETDEQQKERAMKKINVLLRSDSKNNLLKAISLFRSARDVWPEGDLFGSVDMENVDELNDIQTVFMANINTLEELSEVKRQSDSDIQERIDLDNQESEANDSDQEEENREIRVSEHEFDFISFVRRFSHVKIVKAYGLLFKDFFKNSNEVNHAILRMFHRLAWDCKIIAIFFQISLFKTFQMIMNQPYNGSQIHKDATRFIKFVISNFSQISTENDKVFIELLFWKNKKEALEIECGYGETNNENKKKITWTEQEEDELRALYEEFKNKNEEGKDPINFITDNLINQNFTRRNVLKKLRELGLISGVGDFNKAITWTYEEEEELRDLFEQFKHSRENMDPINLIMENLSNKSFSRKNVIKKLKELHLIDSVKQIKPIKYNRKSTWSEIEIEELKELVKEYIDSIHPINRILDHMVKPKSRSSVIKKILELGLVSNRKELQKKKSQSLKNAKSTGQKFLEANRSDECDSADDQNSENDSSCTESESEDSDDYGRPNFSAPASSQKFTTKQSKKSNTSQTTSRKFELKEIECLNIILEEGLKESVSWIVETLQETADEREEDDDWQSVPLLSLTEICNKAMENKDFQKLLLSIGIQKPASHQEMFWRIPATISVNDLQTRAQYLLKGIERYENPERMSEELLTLESQNHEETENFQKTDLEIERTVDVLFSEKTSSSVQLRESDEESSSFMSVTMQRKKISLTESSKRDIMLIRDSDEGSSYSVSTKMSPVISNKKRKIKSQKFSKRRTINLEKDNCENLFSSDEELNIKINNNKKFKKSILLSDDDEGESGISNNLNNNDNSLEGNDKNKAISDNLDKSFDSLDDAEEISNYSIKNKGKMSFINSSDSDIDGDKKENNSLQSNKNSTDREPKVSRKRIMNIDSDSD